MAKPNGRAAMAREWLAAQDTSNLVLERVPPGRSSKTGFVQVIQVGKYFPDPAPPADQGRGQGRRAQAGAVRAADLHHGGGGGYIPCARAGQDVGGAQRGLFFGG